MPMGRKRDKIWAFLRHHWVTATWYISLQRKLQEKCAWNWRLGGHYIFCKLWFNIQRVQDHDHSPTQWCSSSCHSEKLAWDNPGKLHQFWLSIFHVGTQSFRFYQWPVWNFHNTLLWHSSFSVYLLITFRIISTFFPYITVTEFGLSLLLFTNIYNGYNNFSLCFSCP